MPAPARDATASRRAPARPSARRRARACPPARRRRRAHARCPSSSRRTPRARRMARPSSRASDVALSPSHAVAGPLTSAPPRARAHRAPTRCGRPRTRRTRGGRRSASSTLIASHPLSADAMMPATSGAPSPPSAIAFGTSYNAAAAVIGMLMRKRTPPRSRGRNPRRGPRSSSSPSATRRERARTPGRARISACVQRISAKRDRVRRERSTAHRMMPMTISVVAISAGVRNTVSA